MEKDKLKFKIEIIAEIANAHQGDPQIAREIANQAIENGADAIKFQIYFADELLSNDHPRFEHFKNQSFDEKTWLNVQLYNFWGTSNFNLRHYCSPSSHTNAQYLI